MSLMNEFDSQWNSITAFLESEMITQYEKKGGMDLQDIEEKFENEKKRWKVPGQFNYVWFELLKKKNPAIADEFITALDKTRLEQVGIITYGSSISIVLSAVSGAAIGFAACYLINQSIILTGIATIAVSAIGGTIGNTVKLKKKAESAFDVRKQYVNQLKNMQNSLRAIVQKADA